jgi:hypothetical protein
MVTPTCPQRPPERNLNRISLSRLLTASKMALEFKMQEEGLFIRGYIAYDRLVRTPRPTRDRR